MVTLLLTVIAKAFIEDTYVLAHYYEKVNKCYKMIHNIITCYLVLHNVTKCHDFIVINSFCIPQYHVIKLYQISLIVFKYHDIN